MKPLIPVSLIIPTAGRYERLTQTLRSVLAQDVQIREVLIIDGAAEAPKPDAMLAIAMLAWPVGVRVVTETASVCGAGAQRNQAAALSSQPFLWFLDDDVDLEPGCLSALWQAMMEDAMLGGCNALISNQQYAQPGRGLRRLLAWVGCPASGSLAGRCCGPAVNFLPASIPPDEKGRVEWLNTTCTLYRRSALPDPTFLAFFHGYSLMEDLALSLEVGKRWRLRSVPEARIYHDSVPAPYKSKVISRQAMEVANRWYVARRIMYRKALPLCVQMLIMQMIGLLALLRNPERWSSFPGWAIGTGVGLWRIVRHGTEWSGYDP
jgi:GT2 family glycosyltransferase